MRDASLYLTLAQVLPTLLIVVSLELRGGYVFVQRQYDEAQAYIRPSNEPPPNPDAAEEQQSWLEQGATALAVSRSVKALYVAVAIVFAVGEIASLAVPIMGVGNPVVPAVGVIALLAVLLMSASAIFFPWLMAGWSQQTR